VRTTPDWTNSLKKEAKEGGVHAMRPVGRTPKIEMGVCTGTLAESTHTIHGVRAVDFYKTKEWG